VLNGYGNLELDLANGERGRRDDLIEPVLCKLTGAAAATVVNNNAAAVLLALRALGAGKPAAASRAQLVEIGGSFRLPDVMAAGGVRLFPVGTVNRTVATDYERAFAGGAALAVCAHRSNFYFEGSFEEPTVAAIVDIAHGAGKPVIYDLGSGLLYAGLFGDVIPPAEPNVHDLVVAGVDAVTFSGDKLLGGPQGGIIVGKADAVNLVRRDPLYRALRVGKETYALLAATLASYAAGGAALNDIPTYRLLTRPLEVVRSLAGEIYDEVAARHPGGCLVALEDDTALVGGGTLPYLRLPTVGLALRHPTFSPHRLCDNLRRLEPPVLARARGDAAFLDVRSLLDEEAPTLLTALNGWPATSL